MTRSVRIVATGLVVTFALAAIITASAATGWPFAHTFATYSWPGAAGWVARNTPGNLAAGFLQIGIGFGLGYGAHRMGVTEKIKDWATRDIHAALRDHMAEVHKTLDAHHAEQMAAHHRTHDAVTKDTTT